MVGITFIEDVLWPALCGLKYLVRHLWAKVSVVPTVLMTHTKISLLPGFISVFKHTWPEGHCVLCASGNKQGGAVTCLPMQFQKTTPKRARKSILKMRHSSYHKELFLLIPNCSVSLSSYFQSASSLAMYRNSSGHLKKKDGKEKKSANRFTPQG